MPIFLGSFGLQLFLNAALINDINSEYGEHLQHLTRRTKGRDHQYESCVSSGVYTRAAGSVDAFKSVLKSFLFSEHYGM